jgi:formylglycine-generating enzyme required for sulfatase activity
VDGSDLANVLAQWGPCGSSESCSADVNDDGFVNGVDLGNVLASWGFCPVITPGWATLIEAYPDPAVVYDETLRASIVATGYAWRVVDTVTQIEMVLVPPGTFQMGCSASAVWGCHHRESPGHQVTLTNAFYMGRYEVTQAQWTARMGSNPSVFQGWKDSPVRPVEQVSWDTIQVFLGATGMRLPTEAEWEYAYRAGTTTAFHGWADMPLGTSDDGLLASIAWTDGTAWYQTHSVGQLAGNGFGLHDMAGNVWEWVNDWYSTYYYASSPPVNPSGPMEGGYSHRVIRGGCWSVSSRFARASDRFYNWPSSSSYFIGFRGARNP